MLRSAAKNFESVAVVTEPSTYDAILEEMRANDGATTRETRAKLALKVFETTNAYDGAIAAWMDEQLNGKADFSEKTPEVIDLHPRSSRTCVMAKTRIRALRSIACPMPTLIAS